jgi:hypothetical protein
VTRKQQYLLSALGKLAASYSFQDWAAVCKAIQLPVQSEGIKQFRSLISRTIDAAPSSKARKGTVRAKVTFSKTIDKDKPESREFIDQLALEQFIQEEFQRNSPNQDRFAQWLDIISPESEVPTKKLRPAKKSLANAGAKQKSKGVKK